MGGITTVRVTATATVVTGDVRYNGGFCHDLAGDAQMTVYKGTAATAANVIDILAASDEVQTDRAFLPPPGIHCPGGIHCVVNNGDDFAIYYTAEGVVSVLVP